MPLNTSIISKFAELPERRQRLDNMEQQGQINNLTLKTLTMQQQQKEADAARDAQVKQIIMQHHGDPARMVQELYGVDPVTAQKVEEVLKTNRQQDEDRRLNQATLGRNEALSTMELLQGKTQAPETTVSAPQATPMSYPGQIGQGPTLGGGTQQVEHPLEPFTIPGVRGPSVTLPRMSEQQLYRKTQADKAEALRQKLLEKEGELALTQQSKLNEPTILSEGQVRKVGDTTIATGLPKTSADKPDDLDKWLLTKEAQRGRKSTPTERLADISQYKSMTGITMFNMKQAADNAPAPEIKPGSADYKAAQNLAYGKLTFGDFNKLYGGRTPGMVARKTGIYQLAGDLNPSFNPAQFEMGFQLAKNPKVQQQLSSMDNVLQAVPDLLELSAQAKRTGITKLNDLIIKGGFQFGNQHYSNLQMARVAFADELSGALGFGSATDMSRQMGLDLTREDLSADAFASGLQEVVIPFIQRKRDTLLKQMGIYGQPGFNPAAPTPEPAASENPYRKKK